MTCIPGRTIPAMGAVAPFVSVRRRTRLQRRCLEAIAYGDLFDYPFSAGEVHRYLPGERTSLDAVRQAISDASHDGCLSEVRGFVTLRDREALVDVRQHRAGVAARLWPFAERYGRAIARLPFVRMVAVTGALAIDNVDEEADIDFLVVTEPDRLWLCRALVIAIVRQAARQGVQLCPNYFLSARALSLTDRSLFTAHELVQMRPMAGHEMYAHLRRANSWSDDFLPNARHRGLVIEDDRPPRPWWSVLGERLGRSSAGGCVDRWEMRRKQRKFATRGPSPEIAFTGDCCKGHFEGHGQRILAAYEDRLRRLDSLVGQSG